MLRSHLSILAWVVITVVSWAPIVPAQEDLVSTRTVNAEQRGLIIETVLEKIRSTYVHEEVALEISRQIEENHGSGEYDAIESHREFVSRLTRDIREVSNDLHLGVWPIEWTLVDEKLSEEEKESLELRAQYMGHGIKSVRILPGNIGYLELTEWMGGNQAAQKADAAMRILASSEALIIDLRRNGGGEGRQRDVLFSHFFRDSIHTGDSYSKADDSTRQYWTSPAVEDLGMADTPVYVLLSRRSASASEGFAAVLQAQKRAKVVGERSRGAANMTEEYNYPDLAICVGVTSFEVSLAPNGGNWEGVGVEPDIPSPAQDALHVASIDALDHILAGTKGDEDTRRYQQWALERFRAELAPIRLSDRQMSAYTGEYEDSVRLELVGSHLMLVDPVVAPITLIPLGNDAFALKEEEGKLYFLRDEESIEIHYLDGYKKEAKRIRSGLPGGPKEPDS